MVVGASNHNWGFLMRDLDSGHLRKICTIIGVYDLLINSYIYIKVSYLRKSFLVDWVCVPEEAFVGEPPKKVKVLPLAKLITVCMGLKFRNLSPHTGINWQDHCNIMLYIYIGLLSGFGRATSTKHFQGQTAKS